MGIAQLGYEITIFMKHPIDFKLYQFFENTQYIGLKINPPARTNHCLVWHTGLRF